MAFVLHKALGLTALYTYIYITYLYILNIAISVGLKAAIQLNFAEAATHDPKDVLGTDAAARARHRGCDAALCADLVAPGGPLSGDFRAPRRGVRAEGHAAGPAQGPSGRAMDANGDHADDATWVLTSSFVILTMQSGFGMLEMGSAARGHEVNIVLKRLSGPGRVLLGMVSAETWRGFI